MITNRKNVGKDKIKDSKIKKRKMITEPHTIIASTYKHISKRQRRSKTTTKSFIWTCPYEDCSFEIVLPSSSARGKRIKKHLCHTHPSLKIEEFRSNYLNTNGMRKPNGDIWPRITKTTSIETVLSIAMTIKSKNVESTIKKKSTLFPSNHISSSLVIPSSMYCSHCTTYFADRFDYEQHTLVLKSVILLPLTGFFFSSPSLLFFSLFF
jgi:hypothetical protein